MHIVSPICTEEEANGNYVILDQMLSSHCLHLSFIGNKQKELAL